MNKYLKKQLKSRDEKLRYDFLPSMIEIIERPAGKMVYIIMYTIIALIITIIIWACSAKIDIAVTATGIVDTDNALVTLNSVVEGTIGEVKINDGDYVNKGDVICTLVSDVNEANLNEYEYNLEVLHIQKEIYEKIYNKYKENDYTSLEIDVTAYGSNSKYAQAIILEKDIFIDSLDMLDSDESDISKKNQLLTIINNINSIDAKIESANTQLKISQKSLDDRTIIATEEGIYTSKDKMYVGKTVNAGDVMGYITSNDNDYRFMAYVADEDITQLNIGDIVKLKIAAYNKIYEYIEGEIIHIGEIPVNIEGKGMSYVVYIKPGMIPDDIKSGMEGTIDIIVGTRTVMDYFLEPFRKGLHDSLKEK